MKKIIRLAMLAGLLNAGMFVAQEAAPAADNTAATNATAATNTADAAADTNIVATATTNATDAAADTNSVAAAEPKPPEDPVKNLIARFPFDTGFAPDTTTSGLGIPVTFQRDSPASLDGQELAPHKPRLVAGKFGKGLLLESAHVNLYSPSQASAEEASMFQALNGAALTATADKPFEGKQALAVTTKGEAGKEGAALELKVEKALYNGASIVPACYVASVYLKGQGSLKLYLKDLDSDKAGEIVYVDLGNEWKRFACAFRYAFPAKGIGPKHEADWKTLLPPGTNIEVRLQLAIVSTDSSQTAFYADGLQLEQLALADAGTGTGPSPHAWMPGGQTLAGEMMKIETKDDFFGRWRRNGTISFWFLPNWDARDGTQDVIFQVATNLMVLRHANGKLNLAPAGTAFTPSDFQNTWHHIVATWNEEGHWVLYVDGLDYPNDEMMNRPLTSAATLIFGSAAPNIAPNGVIDDLMLFQITLTPEQVKALYAGDLLKPGESPAPTAPTTPAPATSVATPAPVSTAAVPEAAMAPAPSADPATTTGTAATATTTPEATATSSPASESSAPTTNTAPTISTETPATHAPATVSSNSSASSP